MGKHLHEIMGWPGPMTNRQFEAWQAWLTIDLERPSKDNLYQMQTARQIILPHLAKDATPPPLSDYRLTFVAKEREPAGVDDGTDGPPVVTDEMIARFNRERSMVAMGIDPKKVEKRWVDKDGNHVAGPANA